MCICVALLLCCVVEAGNVAQRFSQLPGPEPYTEQIEHIISSLRQAGTIPPSELAQRLSLEKLFAKHLKAALFVRDGSRISSGGVDGNGGRLYTLLASQMDDIARDQMAEPVKAQYSHFVRGGDTAEVAKQKLLRDIGSYEVHVARMEGEIWHTADRLNNLIQQRSRGRAGDMTGDLARHLFRHQVPLHPDDYERLHGIVSSLADKAQTDHEASLATTMGDAAEASSSRSVRALEIEHSL